jgi:hypothetical protein
MRLHNLLVGLGFAVGAVALALLVVVPVFLVVDRIYADGKGLIQLLVVVGIAWLVLARLLSRRRISLK